MRKLITIFIMINMILISATGCKTNSLSEKISYGDAITINGISYSGSYDEVITDDKMIGVDVGAIKFNLVQSKVSSTYQMKDGDATFLKVGTKIYSLKDIDKKDAVAALNEGKWILYKATTQNSSGVMPSGNGITEDTFKASALIVEKSGNKQQVKIEDSEKIKKVLEGIKMGVQTKEQLNFPEGNSYTFYFVIADKNGVGQIAYKYYLNFQDINLKGYVRGFDESYNVDSSVSKIIAESFGTSTNIFDFKLGGKQQIYDIYAEGKFILKKVVKETPKEKFKVKVLEQGAEIWQNGNKVKDNLPGKYKVEIFMKDTKLQEQIKNILTSKKYKLPGVSLISSTTTEEGNSTVLYLSYDKQPELYLDEMSDSFVLYGGNVN
ncbi:MAG: hypothetical protein H7Y18_09655 [Clostridiaceae bacterium]|nr:hypothetical protein [Clostridiaceae bacterium]